MSPSMVSQFMQGPPAEADAALRAIGVDIPWGRSYSNGPGAQFAAEAWRAYAT